MKKKFLFLVFICNIAVFGQTNVSGVISTNTLWTKLNSPYIVTANTVVMPNTVLDIEAGVEVKFNSNVQLLLRGTLRGIGTASDSIKFTANTGVTQWVGVYVDNSSYNAKVSFSYFSGSYAGGLFKVASVGSSDTLMKFTHCHFDHNSAVFDEYDGVKTHIVYVDSCVFSNTSYYCNIGASNNIIKNSKFQGTSYRAFYNSTSQNTIIDNCEFTGFTDAALLVKGSITNSKFYNNQIAIATMSDSSPIITGNSIHDNYIGIQHWNYFSINPSTQINYNEFCNNTYSIKKIYAVDATVPNNCWCTSNSSQIDATIYDFFDAPGLGIVNYMPIATSCPNMITSINENKLYNNISVFPNPTKNRLFIDLIQLKHDYVNLSLMNPLGEVLINVFTGIDVEDYVSLDMDNFTSGIYYLQINFGKEKIVKKIVKI